MFSKLHDQNQPARRPLRVAGVSVCLTLCLGPGSMPTLASAAESGDAIQTASSVPWHRDIAQAQTASAMSKRPVLIIFTAAWSEASKAVQRSTLSAPEAAALITACYEPVNVDVDADPALTRSLGVTNIPAACVIDAQGTLITRFDCPDEPAAFVAAAARAMQEAAQARPAEAAVAAMPREQSDFSRSAAAIVPAASMAPTPASVAPPPVAPAPAPAPAPATFANAANAEPDTTVAAEPSLPPAPPAWQAESAKPSAYATATPPTSDAQRTLLEPAPTTGAAPWLNGAAPQTASATAAPQPATAASARSAAPAEPKPEKKSATDSFFAALKKPFTMFSKPKGAADPQATAATDRPGSAVAATAPDPHGSMPLGLEGYCAVSLAEKGQWVEGRAQWGARHRGRTYLFAGPEQQQAFLANPDRYAPALSGDDPVLACDTGKQIAGQRRYGVTYQARTYLFSSPETRTAFAANPQRYTTRIKLAEAVPPTGTIVR